MGERNEQPKRSVMSALVDALPDAVGSALGAFVVIPFVGDPQVAQAIAAGLGSFAAAPIRVSLDEIRERNSRVVISVAADDDRTASELLQQVASEPGLLELFLRIMRAAEATNQAEKLLALGRALRNAAKDEARLDPETQVVRVLDRLDVVHIRILRAFDRTNDEIDRLTAANGGLIGNAQVDVMTADRIEQRSKLGDQLEAVLHELVVLGLLDEVDATRVQAWEPIPLDDVPQYRRRVDGAVPVWYRTLLGSDVVDRMRLYPSAGAS
jgi:hypothetical protein